MLSFQQSETTAERRRWIIVLVDSADGVTGLTGQTGTAFVSKNGGAGAASTNSIVEVDAGDMPGHYYLELTAGELDTLGMISITMKTAGSLAFHDRAIVSYNDPYTSTGGFSSGTTGGGFKLTKKHIDAIAEEVWKYKFREDVTAQDELTKAATHPTVDLLPVLGKIDAIEIPVTDLSPIMDRIDAIEIPQPRDYTKLFSELHVAIKAISKFNDEALNKSAADFTSKVKTVMESLSSSAATVTEVKDGFLQMKTLLEEFNTKVLEMSDMDKRFENMTSVMQKQQLGELKESMGDITKKAMTIIEILKVLSK